MRFLTAIVAVALIGLLPVKASGETFTSEQYGFSADFPGIVEVGQPQGAETDAKGNFISKSVIIQSRVMGVWTAMVTADLYTAPRKIDAGTTLTMMPKMFAAQLDAVISSNKPGKVGTYNARYFSFQTVDRATKGKGITVIVPSAKPRTYQVLVTYTGLASEENIAELDKFLASFQIK